MAAVQVANVIPFVIVEEENLLEELIVEVMETEIDNKMQTIQFFKYFHNVDNVW